MLHDRSRRRKLSRMSTRPTAPMPRSRPYWLLIAAASFVPALLNPFTSYMIAGLGDEGGSGSWLAAAMKEFGQPNKEEIAEYEQFIDKVLWGGLQYREGPNKYGVRKSLFYYSPPDVPGFQYDSSLNWTTWSSWKKSEAESIGRGYNYPHVVAAYWSMYRVARNHSGLVTNHPWDWYLEQAYQTTKFTFQPRAEWPPSRRLRRVGIDGRRHLSRLAD